MRRWAVGVLAGVAWIGCGGPERAAWQATVNAASTDLQVMALEGALSDVGGARSATIEREEACPDGGRALRCDDGTVEFEDCVMGWGLSMDGTIRVTAGNPRVWAYEGMTGLKDGHPFTISGGYTTETIEDVTTTVVNITHMGVDDGRSFTSVSTGSMTAVGDQVSGSLFHTTTREDFEPSTIGCAFTNITMPLDTEAFTDFEAWSAAYDAAMRKACDFSVKAVVRGMHRHDGDPDPIHILVMNEPFDPSNRVNPGGTHTEPVEDPVMGGAVYLSVGRGGTVFQTTTCYVESGNEVIEAVYDDGLGLDPFTFTCTNKEQRAAE